MDTAQVATECIEEWHGGKVIELYNQMTAPTKKIREQR